MKLNTLKVRLGIVIGILLAIIILTWQWTYPFWIGLLFIVGIILAWLTLAYLSVNVYFWVRYGVFVWNVRKW